MPASPSIPTTVESRIGQLRRDGYTLVVEGAGGVMVPLTWDYTVLDLARACDLDAVVVARAGLGTLNHVAMTVMILRSREIPIRGIVLNATCRARPGGVTNPAALAPDAPGVRIVEIPYAASGALSTTPRRSSSDFSESQSAACSDVRNGTRRNSIFLRKTAPLPYADPEWAITCSVLR